MNYSELRRSALISLKGRWGLAIGGLFLPAIILGLLGYLADTITGNTINQIPTFADLVPQLLINLFLLVLTVPILFGTYVIFLNIARGNHTSLRDLFVFLRSGRLIIRSILTCFILGIYSFLWSLLLIVPGIIKAYAYAMTYYIIIDQPHLSINQAITLSRRMMDGHKLHYFILGLTFIGWILLGMVTLGIGFIWIAPYMHTTLAQFYLKVSGQYSSAGI